MQAIDQESFSSSSLTLTEPPTTRSGAEIKTSSPLPVLSAQALQRGEPLEGKSTTLFRGTYQGEAVTVSCCLLPHYSKSPCKLLPKAPCPFGYRLKGFVRGPKAAS